jgi:hypothetical protein
MAKKAKVTPTYMEGKRPLRISLHDIARVMMMINQKKQMKRFQTAAKSKKAYVTVDADTVNFVKDYIVDNNLHNHPIGKHIVNAEGMTAPGDPYDCNFGKAE